METWTDDTGQRVIVHDKSRCVGQFCSVHNPSQHCMSKYPRHWRDDRKIMERICPHGIGHPDPDDVAFRATQGDHNNVHGCDSCCKSEPKSAVKVDLSDNPSSNFEIRLLQNLTLHVYESTIEPKRWVVEIETNSENIDETLPCVSHDGSGVPQVKVMVNEGVVSNDGGVEPVSKD